MAKEKTTGRIAKPRKKKPGKGTTESSPLIGDHCPCPACQVIASAESGVLFYSEDTTLVPMPKPTAYSRLVFNPTLGTPQWETLDEEGDGGGGTGNYSYSCEIEGWVGGPGETPSCADPGLPPFPTNEVGATAIYECSTGEWTYYPPP